MQWACGWGGLAHDRTSKWRLDGELMFVFARDCLEVCLGLGTVSSYYHEDWPILFAGNFSAKWDKPGMERTSFGDGTSSRTSGMCWHMGAQSNEIGASPFKGVMSRFLMIMVSL